MQLGGWAHLKLLLKPCNFRAIIHIAQYVGSNAEVASCNLCLSTGDQLTQCIVDEDVLILQWPTQMDKYNRMRKTTTFWYASLVTLRLYVFTACLSGIIVYMGEPYISTAPV